MIFTGKNLELIRAALDRAVADVHMTLGQLMGCPDLTDEDEEEFEQEAEAYRRLAARIDRKHPPA